MSKVGVIIDCKKKSSECNFRCCDQSRPEDDDYCLNNSILLYPGEWENLSNKSNMHLIITGENSNGKLAYCNRKCFDQSQCSEQNNLKPLDCKSYPFFPVIVENKLKLSIDTSRCPLSKNIDALKEHYHWVLKEWQRVISDNQEVKSWIQSIKLEGYTIIDLAKDK